MADLGKLAEVVIAWSNLVHSRVPYWTAGDRWHDDLRTEKPKMPGSNTIWSD